jgi:phosphoglycolate phosphatase
MIKAIIFDKDGTLFDFGSTWNVWAHHLIHDLSEGDAALRTRLADVLDYDLTTSAFRPTSFVIAGTNTQLIETLLPLLPQFTYETLKEEVSHRASNAPQASVVDLHPYLTDLRARGLALAVMTNDHEAVAQHHLDQAGVRDLFDFVIGSDSGYGGKPDPDPLLALAKMMGVDPSECVMVGDSTHDLVAASRAGITGVGVLTGIAEHDEIAPFAKTVLKDISEIPAWLENS